VSWQWSDKSWTRDNRALAQAVYERVRAEAAHAPMLAPLGPGNVLLRSIKREHLKLIGNAVAEDDAYEAIRVRDHASDVNRFTGTLPALFGHAAVQPRRGGVYCSLDIRAAIAELMHYSDGNLSRSLIGDPARLQVFSGRAFVALRPVGELSVVALDSDSPAALPFLARIGSDEAVAEALKANGFGNRMFEAVYAARNYAAARGLGLGLESNREIDGLLAISARDFETVAGQQQVLRTGDNAILFGIGQRVLRDKLRIQSLHLVDPVPGSSTLVVRHFERAAGGRFVEAAQSPFQP
jgi:hypothetical protein